MSLNFGTEASANMFPSLPATTTTTNPWKQTPLENQLSLLSKSHHPGDDQSLASTTDNSFATTLASLQSEMASVVTTIIVVNEQECAKEKQVYKDRRKEEEKSWKEAQTVHKVQHKLNDDKWAEVRRDDLKRFEKLEERRGSTGHAILGMM